MRNALNLTVLADFQVVKTTLLSIDPEALNWVETELVSMSDHLEVIRDIARDTEAAIQEANQRQLQVAMQNMSTPAGSGSSNSLSFPVAHFNIPQQRVFLSALGSSS